MALDELRFPANKPQTPEYLPVRTLKRGKIKINKKPLDPNLKQCPNPKCKKIQNKNNKICENCGLNFNIGDRIINIITNKCSNEDKILLIVNNDNKLKQVNNLFKNNNLHSSLKILHNGTYEELFKKYITDDIYDEILMLININKLLNYYYDIPIYNNIYSSKYLTNLSILKNNVNYINISNTSELYMQITSLQEYIYLIKSLGISKNNISDLDSIIDRILLTKNDIAEFNKNIEKIYEIYKLYGVTITQSFSIDFKRIEIVEILYEKPYLVKNKNEIYTFLNILNEYKEINNKNKDSAYYIKNFKNKNRFLQELIINYNNYISNYKKDIEILNLKQEFGNFGFNLYKLIDFNNFKQVMLSFNNPIIYKNNDYFLLCEKFKEYFESNIINFSNTFKKNKKKLEKIIKLKIKEKQNNIQDNNEIYELFNQFSGKLNYLSINIHTLNEFEENINNINLLTKKPKLIEDYNFYKVLTIFDENDINVIDLTPAEYFNKNYDKLCELIDIFFIDINDKYEIEKYKQIIDNYNKINTLIYELKIDINSNIDLNRYNKNNNASKIKLLKNFIQSNQNKLKYKSEQNISLKEFLNYTLLKINKFKTLYSLKNKIFNILNESNEITDKLDNSTFLIMKCYELKNELNLNEYKEDIDKIARNMRLLKDVDSYIPLKKIYDSIYNLYKKYKFDVKYTSLYNKGLFNENRLKTDDIINKISDLNNIFKSLDYLLIRKNKEYLKFKDIEFLSKRYYDANNQYKYLKKVKKCDINNFNETIDDLKNEFSFKTNDYKFNKINYDITNIKEIMDLSSKLEIDGANNLFYYEYDELLQFYDKIKNNAEFTNYYNERIFNDNIIDFYNSSTFMESINKLDLKLNNLQKYIKEQDDEINLNENQDFRKTEKLSSMKEIIEKTNLLFNEEISNISQNIVKYQIIIENLLKLCETYPIMDNNEIYIKKLNSAENKIHKYQEMNIYENKIDSYEFLINNNLQNIWKGYSTNLNKIKNKFEIDLKFTELYNNKVFSLKTIENLNNFSKLDLKTLKKIKSKLMLLFKKIYSDETYINEDIYLINKKILNFINQLEKTTNQSDYIKLFSEINQYINNDKLKNLINILNVKINQPQNYELMLNLEKKLKSIDDKIDYNEDTLNSLCDNIKYSQLINLNIINKESVKLIKNDLDTFFEIFNQFEEYRFLVLERLLNIEEYDLTTDFNLILDQNSEKRLFLLNEEMLEDELSDKFVNQFDKLIIFSDCNGKKIKKALNKKKILYKFAG